MPYKKQNDAIINRLFKALPKAVDKSVGEAYEKLLDDGVQYCLDAHASGMMHLVSGDSYGWVLLHNGREVKRRIFAENGPSMGNATKELDRVRHHLPKTGWAGVVLAGMEPASYFMLTAEFYYMRSGISKLSGRNFNKYFKQVVL